MICLLAITLDISQVRNCQRCGDSGKYVSGVTLDVVEYMVMTEIKLKSVIG